MRNFKGARAEFVDDFLYTPPMEMMEKVLAKKQAEFDMASAMGATLSQHLNVDFLPDAEEEATLRQIQGHYRSQIDNLNKQMMADPMNYQKYAMQAQALGRDIQENLTKGSLGNIAKSGKAWKEWINSEAFKKQEAADPDLARRIKQANLGRFTGQAGRSQDGVFEGKNYYSNRDLTEDFDKLAKAVVPELSEWSFDSNNGMYIKTTAGKTEKLTPERLQKMILAKLESDPTLKQYFMERGELGYEGFTDKDGNMLSGYNADGSINSNTMMGKALNYISSFAYSNTSSSTSLKPDEVALAKQRRQWELEDRAYEEKKAREEQLEEENFVLAGASEQSQVLSGYILGDKQNAETDKILSQQYRDTVNPIISKFLPKLVDKYGKKIDVNKLNSSAKYAAEVLTRAYKDDAKILDKKQYLEAIAQISTAQKTRDNKLAYVGKQTAISAVQNGMTRDTGKHVTMKEAKTFVEDKIKVFENRINDNNRMLDQPFVYTTKENGKFVRKETTLREFRKKNENITVYSPEYSQEEGSQVKTHLSPITFNPSTTFSSEKLKAKSLVSSNSVQPAVAGDNVKNMNFQYELPVGDTNWKVFSHDDINATWVEKKGN